jgi:chromosome partitioning protein
MPGMREDCSVCGTKFDVQFRYQMEERDGAFWFFCSQACHQRSMDGGAGQTCDACHKRFKVEFVAQVVTVKGARRYACTEACRAQILEEARGVRLGAVMAQGAPAMSADDLAAIPPVLRPTPVPASASASPSASAQAPRASTVLPPARPAAHRVRRLAVFNHKGGTGKTTTAVSLAAGFAEKGLRVLLVDTDSQGNVGVSMGTKADKSLYHVLVMGLRPQVAAVEVRPRFHVLPANETLAAAELYLAGRQNRDRVLKERLAAAEADYDVILLDCSPSLSLLNQNALVFADGIVVPVACDFLSLVGVRQVIKTVKSVNSLLHHPVQIEAVLPTFYDARARICRDAVSTLKEHFGDLCLEPIRANIKVKEAPAQGRTIFEHAPDSYAAADYLRTVERLIAGAPAKKNEHPAPVAATA